LKHGLQKVQKKPAPKARKRKCNGKRQKCTPRRLLSRGMERLAKVGKTEGFFFADRGKISFIKRRSIHQLFGGGL